MFKTLFGLATDVSKTVAAPIEIAALTTRVVTKPVADVAESVVEEVEEVVDELTRD